MRSLMLFAVLCSACGSSTPAAPSTPTPTPTPPPAPTAITLSGTLTATNGGQVLAGVNVAVFGSATATSTAGAFAVTVPLASIYGVSLSGAAIVPRTVNALVNSSRTIGLSAIALDGGFDLNFYRQFVRNTLDAPAGLEPIRRWTVNPSFYMKVTDEAGVMMDAKSLDNAEQVIRAYVPQWTAGKFAVAAFERGTSVRAPASGWINVNWSNQTLATTTSVLRCGDARLGENPGTINLYYKAAQNQFVTGQCRCAGVSEIGPRVVSHELGHAMGFFHTDGNDVMHSGAGNYCDATLSARERYHAAIAYARPVGNVDPDSDPTSAVSLAPLTVR